MTMRTKVIDMPDSAFEYEGKVFEAIEWIAKDIATHFDTNYDINSFGDFVCGDEGKRPTGKAGNTCYCAGLDNGYGVDIYVTDHGFLSIVTELDDDCEIKEIGRWYYDWVAGNVPYEELSKPQ